MNIETDPAALPKFGMSQPAPRLEDPTLLRGEGRYTDDVSLPGQAYAAMVRSPVAHATIRGLDVAAARAMPGVLAVITHAELEAAVALHAGSPSTTTGSERAKCVRGRV